MNATAQPGGTMLVRYGEISLKGANRQTFEHALRRRLSEAIERAAGADAPVRVRLAHGRIYVDYDEQEDDVRERLLFALTRTFGVVSVSPARRVPLDWGALVEAAEALGRRAKSGGARTFKVEARRANKSFPKTSPEIARELGAALAARLDWPVDVRRPDAVVQVEVREWAYVYAETYPGPGGLPLGTGGRGMLLLSGGIDSPVAGWLLAKRGLEPVAVYFHSPPYTGEKALEKVRDLCRALAVWCGPLELYTVPFTEISQQIYERAPDPLGTVLMRRFMVRIAQRLGDQVGAGALITGESLGQVASQTIESIAAIADVADRPILRPLVGLDKAEIVELARRIGTYEISVRPFPDCCSVFVPRNPATRPRIDDCRRAEERLDVEALVAEAVARTARERLGPAPAGRMGQETASPAR
ncbi:MAG: tRNA 4-thiouridine(8) synthase ThiI [Clostridia bacterium]|nr:tRNA 4-thiouridine(8) synthase ThiI [Clostridia bacterium]